jgi:hypothetical protein
MRLPAPHRGRSRHDKSVIPTHFGLGAQPLHRADLPLEDRAETLKPAPGRARVAKAGRRPNFLTTHQIRY